MFSMENQNLYNALSYESNEVLMALVNILGTTNLITSISLNSKEYTLVHYDKIISYSKALINGRT